MSDLTPAQLAKVEHYARLWHDDELQGCCDIHPESAVGKVLTLLPALVAEVRKLSRLRDAMESFAAELDDNGKVPGSIGPFIALEIRNRMKETVNG